MIGRLVIENYKSVENLSLDLGRVTVLIGANGSGKSNILEAIALCSAAAANKLDNEFLYSRGIRVSDDLRLMLPAFSSGVKFEITISVDTRSDEASDFDNAKFIVKLSRDTNEFERVNHYSKIMQFWNIFRDDITVEEAATRYDYYEKKRVLHNQKFGIDSFLPFSPENTFLRRFEEEGQIQPLGIRGEGLFKLLTVLARPENEARFKDLQARLQLLDWFGEFQIGGNVGLGERSLQIRDEYLDGDLAYITQRSANEGFLFLLFYFALFVAEQTPKFFAIDNIDASLNPKLCAELVRQLAELAEKYDKQVILTTHNPAVLDGLDLRDANQKLYVIERDLEGRTQARAVPPPRPPEKNEEPVPLSEAFLRGYIGGLPKNF